MFSEGSQSTYSNPYTDFNSVDAEDIFRMFFGRRVRIHVMKVAIPSWAACTPSTGRTARAACAHSSSRRDNPHRMLQLFLFANLTFQPSLLQRLLPLIMIVGYVVLMFFINRPAPAPFSINRTPEYSVQRVQPETRLPYYVTPSFDSSDRNVRNVESSVLRYYFQQYEYLCMRDVQREMQVRLCGLDHV